MLTHKELKELESIKPDINKINKYEMLRAGYDGMKLAVKAIYNEN